MPSVTNIRHLILINKKQKHSRQIDMRHAESAQIADRCQRLSNTDAQQRNSCLQGPARRTLKITR